MKAIAFVIPYFGKFPNYFTVWIDTCKNNPTIDFLIFTDNNDTMNRPANVKIYNMGFEELQKLFQSRFPFPIALDSPYKLCDFKPAYGEVFLPYLEKYDFWGHCDIDILWGDIRAYVTDELLEKYDKLYSRGHCCLYRNQPQVNAWYRTLSSTGRLNWKKVFQSPKSCCFDEWAGHEEGGINFILQDNGIPFYNNRDMMDLIPSKGYFKDIKWSALGEGLYVKYDYGKLYVYSNGKVLGNILYCHYQKRKIRIDDTYDPNCFYLMPPGYITSDIKKMTRNRWKEFGYELCFWSGKIKKCLTRNRVMNLWFLREKRGN